MCATTMCIIGVVIVVVCVVGMCVYGVAGDDGIVGCIIDGVAVIDGVVYVGVIIFVAAIGGDVIAEFVDYYFVGFVTDGVIPISYCAL